MRSKLRPTRLAIALALSGAFAAAAGAALSPPPTLSEDQDTAPAEIGPSSAAGRALGDAARFGNYEVNSARGFAGLDRGYDAFRQLADVDGDGRADYCRLVGDAPNIFVSCALATAAGSFGNYDISGDPGDAVSAWSFFHQMADFCRLEGILPLFTRLRCLVQQGGGFVQPFESGLGFEVGDGSFRQMADVDGDGHADFCRFLGEPPSSYLSCALAEPGGYFGGRVVNSDPGFDRGYEGFRQLADVDADGRADYCRFVGDSPNVFLSCARARADGRFGAYDFNSAGGFDRGYTSFRQMADVNGDRRADYCRMVGDPPNVFLSCALAQADGGFGSYDVNSARGFAGLDPGYGYFRQMANVNLDARADYCRFVGNPGEEFLSCAARFSIRRSVASLSPAGAEIASLRAGVAAMKARQPSDPTSWAAQAALHGDLTSSGEFPHNQCQHSSFFFLAWHRIYLYYFERILRAASNDPELALPYWNYTDSAQRLLPAAFREPNEQSNALWVAARNTGFNAGTAGLPDSTTSYTTAFGLTSFSSGQGASMTFGGGSISAPAHFSNVAGQLELQPHNAVHAQIGGSDGWMSDPRFAALDPIFWLHHANIDRLWELWSAQGGGRTNPVDSAIWMDTRFTFWDERRNPVDLTGRQIVQTAAQLGYVYEGGPDPGGPPIATREEGAPTEPEPRPTPRVLLQATPRVELGDRPARLVLPLATGDGDQLLAQVRDGSPETRAVLILGEADFGRNPGVTYELYLHLEAGAEPDPESPFYVGTLAFFGPPRRLGTHGLGGHHGHGPGTFAFDLSGALSALVDQGLWDPGALTVTFVERGLVPAEGMTLAPPAGVKATLGLAAIVLE